MTFKHCSIAGELYLEGSQNIIKNVSNSKYESMYIQCTFKANNL